MNLKENWCKTWKLPFGWEVEIEWLARAQSYDLWIHNTVKNEDINKAVNDKPKSESSPKF